MWELLRRNPKFIAGLAVVVIIVMFGVVGPMVNQDPFYRFKDESGNYIFVSPQFPFGRFILGTTSYGQDIFAQLCEGIRNTLYVGLIGGGLSTLIAIIFGALFSYKGGLVDETSNIITNIVLVFPMFPALIALAAFLGPEGRSFWTVGLIIALTEWPWAARAMRSQILSLREREFVNLARMSGLGSVEVVIKEVLPNMLAYVVMVFVLLMGGAMLSEVWLSVLGLGPMPWVNATLGGMIYNCMSQSIAADWRAIWWWYIPPGLVLTTLLSAIFVMHAGMDEVFNPRLRRM
jgi:peptide/nickel transport system permease protein